MRFLLPYTVLLLSLFLISCSPGKKLKTAPVGEAQAPSVPAFLQAKIFQSDSLNLPYRWISPLETTGMPVAMKNFTQSADGKYPLVIFLHGSGERGNDNQAQLKNGISSFWAPDFYARHPHFFLAPQCPNEQRWSFRDFDKEIFFREEPMPPMQALMELLETLFRENPAIDRNRVYLTGLSMGGLGTFNLLVRQPDWFAAAIPICGGGDPSDAPEIRHIAIWVFHGSADKVVLPRYSRQMVLALRQAAAPMIGYSEFPGWGHNSWDDTYGDPKVLEWLFRQRKVTPLD